MRFYKLLFKSVDPTSKNEVEQTYLIPETSLTQDLREKLRKTGGNCAPRNPQFRFIPRMVLNQRAASPEGQGQNALLGVTNAQTVLIQNSGLNRNVQTYPALLRGGNLDVRTQTQTSGVTTPKGSSNPQNPIQNASPIHFFPNLSPSQHVAQPTILAGGQKTNLDVRAQSQTLDVATPKGSSRSQNPIQKVYFIPNLPPGDQHLQQALQKHRGTNLKTVTPPNNKISDSQVTVIEDAAHSNPQVHLISSLPPGSQHLRRALQKGRGTNLETVTPPNNNASEVTVIEDATQIGGSLQNLPPGGQPLRQALQIGRSTNLGTVTPPNDKASGSQVTDIENAAQSNPQIHFISDLTAAASLRGQPGVAAMSKTNLILDPSQQNLTFVPLISGPDVELMASKVYKCRTCSQGFATPGKLRIHRYKAHKSRIHECDECGKSFHVLSSLNAHKLVHTDGKNFPCDVCGKVFKTELYVKNHLRSHAAKVKAFACDACDKKFHTAQQLKYHNNIEHLNRRHKCNVCHKEYRQVTSLNIHLRTHDPLFVKSSVKCDECDATFSHKNAVRSHKSRVHLGNLYVCDVCGKEITNAAGFKIHVRTHTGEKPFVCEFCGKAFISKNRLNMHVRIHTKEKPYPCKVCGKRFTQVGSVTIHVRRVHRHEKQFHCKVCDKKYVSKDQLRAHTKSHVGLTATS